MTRNGALAGMLAGAVMVIIWRQGGWLGLYEMVPGFAAACAAIVSVSLLGAPPAPAMTSLFARMREQAGNC
jgi:sodium/proline symporter